jgi:hypothetical protein
VLFATFAAFRFVCFLVDLFFCAPPIAKGVGPLVLGAREEANDLDVAATLAPSGGATILNLLGFIIIISVYSASSHK